jgi:hypothetical protein
VAGAALPLDGPIGLPSRPRPLPGGGWDELVERTLHLLPAERYRDGAELLQALQKLRADRGTGPSARGTRRRALWPALVGVALVLLATWTISRGPRQGRGGTVSSSSAYVGTSSLASVAHGPPPASAGETLVATTTTQALPPPPVTVAGAPPAARRAAKRPRRKPTVLAAVPEAPRAAPAAKQEEPRPEADDLVRELRTDRRRDPMAPDMVDPFRRTAAQKAPASP